MSDTDDVPPPLSPDGILAVEDRLRATGRNDPCPCGSGRKYKKCCLNADETRVREATHAFKENLRSGARPAPGSVGETKSAEGADDIIDIEGSATGEAVAAEPPPVGRMASDSWGETRFAPEVEQSLDRIWAEFELIAAPTTEQMDAHLSHLLALPSEATDWTDLFHLFARHRHADLPGVFRRIAASVPPTKATGLSFFYWAAVEKFVSTGRSDLVPEVVAQFCRLDRESYDADALSHVKHWVLAAGCEAEALALAEYFLPVMRGDDLMPHAVPEESREIFELRVGAALRHTAGPPGTPHEVATALMRGIEEEIYPAFARQAALVACGITPAPTLTRGDFDLSPEDAGEEELAADTQRRFTAFLQVAREAWEVERRPPGIAFHGQWLLLNAVYRDRAESPRRSKKARAKYPETLNLLDSLQPGGLERRVAQSSHDIMGTNPAQAHLLIEAHATLLSFARRHALIEADLAERTETQLLQLKTKLGFPR